MAVMLSWYFVWNYSDYKVNFMGGDAKDYYSGLVSTFITHDFTNQSGNDVFLLKTSTGTINVHPIGVSVLLLPFFLVALLFANLFHFPTNGYSLPFQISTSTAALVYAVVGLIYLKKLFRLQQISDNVTALLVLLVFFGTNLLNYTLSEAGMSHVYSFSLIAVFLYHSSSFVFNRQNKSLILSFLILGLILLVRPNNIFIILSVFIWFRSLTDCKSFFKSLFANKVFYVSVIFTTLIVLLQSLVWYLQSDTIFHNTYKADGFYWMNPQILKMLFGFDGGFFIYTPLCLLLLLGLPVLYKENKFSFFASLTFLAVLFYFFASYWAYSYFDGLGIRVLVDYYALFAFFGAKLFSFFSHKFMLNASLLSVAALLTGINLIYNYQINRSILLRAGMTFQQWKYVFLKTTHAYQESLGGSHELIPYSKVPVPIHLSSSVNFTEPFDFENKEYGPSIVFDSLKLHSNRINIQIHIRRKEKNLGSSTNAYVNIVQQNKITGATKSHNQFKLNEAPSVSCCEYIDYNYSINITNEFKPEDGLVIFISNFDKTPFLINKFSAELYNHNYLIN